MSSRLLVLFLLICAQLYEPYADNPETNGFMRIDMDVLYDVVPKFLKDGWQVVRIPSRSHCRLQVNANHRSEYPCNRRSRECDDPGCVRGGLERSGSILAEASR